MRSKILRMATVSLVGIVLLLTGVPQGIPTLEAQEKKKVVRCTNDCMWFRVCINSVNGSYTLAMRRCDKDYTSDAQCSNKGDADAIGRCKVDAWVNYKLCSWTAGFWYNRGIRACCNQYRHSAGMEIGCIWYGIHCD